MGIRKKIMVGFISLAVLLFFSGTISIINLTELNKATKNVLYLSVRNVELTKEMLSISENQHQLITFANIGSDIAMDSILLNNHARMEISLYDASKITNNRAELDSVAAMSEEYHKIIIHYMNQGKPANVKWFTTIYYPSYIRLSESIKKYFAASQHDLEINSSKLSDTAYRAIIPGILALTVGILILLIFLYIIDLYFVRPIVRINKSLKGYIQARLPFTVKMEGKDEVFELKEQIENLITLFKSKKIE